MSCFFPVFTIGFEWKQAVFHIAKQSHKFIHNRNLNLRIASDIAAALSGKNNTTGKTIFIFNKDQNRAPLYIS